MKKANKQLTIYDEMMDRGVPDNAYQKDVLQNVEERKAKNKSQNEIILDFFIKHRGRGFTAWQVRHIVEMPLITSVRRAMSTLTKAGLLIKLEETTIECQGERNHYYKAI